MVARITISHNNVITVEASTETLNLLSEEFKAPDFSECFVFGQFRKERMKMVKFLIRSPDVPTTALLPIGFLDELVKFFKKHGATYKVIDNRKFEKLEFSDEEIEKCLGYINLYDYQVDSVKAMLESPNGIIKATTAAGKTEIFIAYCKLAKRKTLILFARIDLAKQTLRRMKKAGLDAGIVQGNNVDENHQVVMATVQSGHKLEGQYDCIIVDECHRAAGEQYQILLKNKHTLYRYGFSATPFVKKNKLQTKRTMAWLGNIMYTVHAEKLMDEGRISKPTIHIIPVKKPDGIADLKWPFCETAGIIENKYRNNIIAEVANNLSGQKLILVQKIDHGEKLQALINNSYFLYGESDVKEREEYVARFEAGEPITLIASTIFDEGIDIKTVNHVIITGGGQSFIKVLQRLGRGLRITETKKTVDIYDFYDYTNPTLKKHSDERIKIYRSEGFNEIKVFKIEDFRKDIV